MRRPGPLPPSSGTEEDASAHDEERRLAERRSAMQRLGIGEPVSENRASSAPAGDHVDTAPIVQIRSGGSAEPRDGGRAEGRPRAGARGADDEAKGRASSRADDGQVGWRGVWRAARARRKALRAEVRRFTVRARRRRLAWLIGIGSVLLLVVGSVGAAYSPLFAVEEISIEGAEQLDAAAVESAMADQLGKPLPLVDASAVKAALVAFPLIETYTLEAHPPHDLVIRVVERTPVGVVESEAGFTTVDAAGVVLATAGERPAGLPLIQVEGGTGADAFRAVGQVLRSLPEDLRARVTGAGATSPEDVTLTLGDGGPQVIWGSVDDTSEKVSTLQGALKGALAEGATVYDVSAPGTIIVR